MSPRDHDEPLNAVEQYAAELLGFRAWPEPPAREPVTGQGRSPAENTEAAQIIGTCLGLLVLIGLAVVGFRVIEAVLMGVWR